MDNQQHQGHEGDGKVISGNFSERRMSVGAKKKREGGGCNEEPTIDMICVVRTGRRCYNYYDEINDQEVER